MHRSNGKGAWWRMDALTYLTSRASIARPTDTARTRRALLNATMRALLEIRPPVTQLVLDPDAIPRLRAARLVPRTLLHPPKDV